MIYNQWYAVLESKEVGKGKLIGVTRFGEKLVFGRTKKGQVLCLWDRCAHRGAALSVGKVKDDRIKCPFHGLEFDKTGQCQLIPAYGRNTPVDSRFQVNSYITEEKYGFIWVWYGDRQENYPPIPFFEELNGLSYKTFQDHWTVHYSRAIENQLDVVHLPFVHPNTIGRGNKTVVDGPKARLVNDEIHAWVYNRKDDGSPPLKPQDIPEPTTDPIVKFRFPHIWRLAPTPKMNIFIAFTPIDEENTLIYMRFYQKILKIPLLKQLVNFFGLYFSKIILRQDKRVVLTQQPKKTSLKMGENLITGDLPIVLYRRRRQELIDLNSKG
ncbi:MAG TPA: aromatic ring-hydroxylating dioxygenase subunit alpha [Candidatus Deferrimicrobium sp.]|nr:aromatic ring-hydroxylating dioxygenase subunit alpha [Candidatus Deferrimicrobium sp.]